MLSVWGGLQEEQEQREGGREGEKGRGGNAGGGLWPLKSGRQAAMRKEDQNWKGWMDVRRGKGGGGGGGGGGG